MTVRQIVASILAIVVVALALGSLAIAEPDTQEAKGDRPGYQRTVLKKDGKPAKTEWGEPFDVRARLMTKKQKKQPQVPIEGETLVFRYQGQEVRAVTGPRGWAKATLVYPPKEPGVSHQPAVHVEYHGNETSTPKYESSQVSLGVRNPSAKRR